MSVKGELNNKFLLQNFTDNDRITEDIDKYKIIAAGYAQTENAIAVLSDLKERVSHIYYGGMAQTLGICKKGEYHCVNSIWEEDVFKYVLPEFMDKRHCDELKFIHFLKNTPKRNYADFYLTSTLRMMDRNGCTYSVRHRVFYVAIQSNGSIRLALCLYNLTGESDTESRIYDSTTGTAILLEQQDYSGMLSDREKEVLQLIEQGKLSKEISDTLSISIHTVNRHRQNILSKLCASNSVEACRIAKHLKLI